MWLNLLFFWSDFVLFKIEFFNKIILHLLIQQTKLNLVNQLVIILTHLLKLFLKVIREEVLLLIDFLIVVKVDHVLLVWLIKRNVSLIVDEVRSWCRRISRLEITFNMKVRLLRGIDLFKITMGGCLWMNLEMEVLQLSF